MKKSKVSKTMLIIATFVIICCISGINSATTSNLNDLFGDDGIQNITELQGKNETPLGNNEAKNEASNNVTPIGNQGTAKPISQTKNEIPALGANDTILWAIIGVTVIAAVYTYKKVRDYEM